MTDTGYVTLLLSTNATLVAALVWLVKAERKERREVIEQNTQLLNRCINNLDTNTRVMEKVITLLTNWRGH